MIHKSDMGVIGLAVMGRNLVLNLLDHQFSVQVYNRTVETTKEFVASNRDAYPKLQGARTPAEFVQALRPPRKILLMVRAGAAVDTMMEILLPLLEAGDILMDGGNSLYTDTNRRLAAAAEKGVRYVGLGISGGEEGARRGPSLMPGGDPAAWEAIKPILQGISAKVPEPCCQWIGPGGSGHFVKMIHNGIEYGDIQLLCEAWDLMHRGLGMSPEEGAEVFHRWNGSELESYLVEITGNILAYREESGDFLIGKILDTAGQKGTGKWSVIESLNMGVPVPLMGEAVFARLLSALKGERVAASEKLSGPRSFIDGGRDQFLKGLKKAVLGAKILSYAQGFLAFRQASEQFDWNLNLGEIASLWRGGCIIRSGFLDKIRTAFEEKGTSGNMLMAPYFRNLLEECQGPWREVVAEGILAGIPLPALSSALAFYDGYRSAVLPANLLQAQRDYFGGHQYERIDAPRGKFFHTDWTGRGGDTAASTYSV